MNKGQVDYAERRAKGLFDDWVDCTGVFTPGMGYYNEAAACIEDAVHCGIQMALYGKIKIEEGRVVQGDFKESTDAVELSIQYDAERYLEALKAIRRQLADGMNRHCWDEAHRIAVEAIDKGR